MRAPAPAVPSAAAAIAPSLSAPQAAPTHEDMRAYATAEAAAGLRSGISAAVAGGSPTSTYLGATAAAGKKKAAALSATAPTPRRVATGKLAAFGGSSAGGGAAGGGDAAADKRQARGIERVAALKTVFPGLPIR